MCKKSGNAVTLDCGRLHSIAGFMATSVSHLMSEAPTGMPQSALEEVVLNCFDKIREQAEAKLSAMRAPKAPADQIDQALQCATPSPAGDPPRDPSDDPRGTICKPEHGTARGESREPPGEPPAQAQLGQPTGHLLAAARLAAGLRQAQGVLGRRGPGWRPRRRPG